MNEDDTNFNSPDENGAPFGSPDPDMDDMVSTRPETDGDIDEQELYDEGLAGAAELDDEEDEREKPEGAGLPDGFHIE